MAVAEGTARQVSVAELSQVFVEELEGRDDDADWEIEDWSKTHVVQELRRLGANAESIKLGDEVRLVFSATLTASVVDLSPGVAAHFTEDGKLAFLAFNVLDARAARRLALAKEFEPS
ncbi:unnamed protein product [Cladocopium goreaui]|uniref:Uncharacterized protein n=1 Tax=Cladocopium goreaui TaxID=2562237 RepID=A0A9P1DW87_9DINO|nr:unnamed protein product [Cladocopium goreaui]